MRQQVLLAPAGALRQFPDQPGLAAGLYVLRVTPRTSLPSSRQVVRE